jgi:hypothetical protein
MHFPNSTVLLEEGDVVNATTFSSKGERPESSLALTDPIATHLLVETALGDSKAFDVLPFEELDSLKKEDSIVVSRIQTMRRKLAIETKVRDAAMSLNRLNGSKGSSSSASSPTSPQRSLSVSKNERPDHVELELAESTKKCEALSKDLYYLEQRSRQTQTKLLRHTAAVLQLTYGNGHRPHINRSGIPGGRPDSPDSLDNADTDWDKMNDFTNGKKPFHGRGRNLDGYSYEMNEDISNNQISAATMKLREDQFAIGKRLGELSNFVREILSQVNTDNAFAKSNPPQLPDDPLKIEFAIFEQLSFLDWGLGELKEEQNVRRLMQPLDNGSMVAQPGNRSLGTYDDAEAKLLRQLLELNNKLIQVLHATKSPKAVPRVPSIRDGIGSQIRFAHSTLLQITKAMRGMSEAAQRSDGRSLSDSQKLSQYATVVDGLWQIILSCEEDAQRRKNQEFKDLSSRKAPVNDSDSDSGISLDDADDGLPSDFSLPVFSIKVQWLIANSVYLKEKQDNMRRRMNLLHDTVSGHHAQSSDATRGLQTQLDRAIEDHTNAKADLSLVTSRLSSSQARLADLEQSHTDLQQSHAEINQTHTYLNQTHADLQQSHVDLQQSHADLQQSHADLRQSHAGLQQSHAALTDSRDALEQNNATAKKQAIGAATRDRDNALAQAKQATADLKALEAEVVRLKSELTIARADADAAYGSRSERAAELARAADGQAAARESQLRSELKATLIEFEELARASVEAEREQEEREREVDKLRDTVEALEAQLSEEKIGKIGLKSPGSDGVSASASTSSGVLRSEFKKMMKDMRADHQKALRVSLKSPTISFELQC